MMLDRLIGVALRNKGYKVSDQIRDPKKFFRFWWEKITKTHVPTKEEWKALDKKYGKRKK